MSCRESSSHCTDRARSIILQPKELRGCRLQRAELCIYVEDNLSRLYSARVIAFALRVPLKWVDNLLSHYELPGITRSRQGVARRITDEGLLAIEGTRLLTTELGVPLAHAAEIAAAAVQSRQDAHMRFLTASGVVVVFPVGDIERRLHERVVDAVEGVAPIRRGRPPRERAIKS